MEENAVVNYKGKIVREGTDYAIRESREDSLGADKVG